MRQVKRILIIGGTGTLSAAVVDSCVVRGYDVTILNRGNKSSVVNSNVRIILCDARNEEQVKQKTKGLQYDAVIDFIVFTKEQIKVSLSLFAPIAKQYVFISSAQAYNTSLDKELVENDEKPNPLWSYSVNKDECEKYLQSYCKEKNVNYTIIRPGVNYDNRRIPYGIVPPYGKHWTIIARILAGKPIITWNNGQNRLNLTRVEDFAEGLVGLLGNKGAYNECFNVVGDYVYSWGEVLETLGRQLNTKVSTINIPVDQYADELSPDNRERLLGGRTNNLVCSNAKLKTILRDYHSTIELAEGLKMVHDGYKKNNYYDGIDYKWDAEQDRILKKLSPNGYKGKYVSYLQHNFIDNFHNLCEWKIEYYAENKQMKFCWKIIMKFIYSPLRRLLSIA